jgi:hypothetical protein
MEVGDLFKGAVVSRAVYLGVELLLLTVTGEVTFSELCDVGLCATTGRP